ncbi:MAG TPA: Ldh family oxidoreductase [Verrucomicrobiae bacterium]|jgi:uncharacterized oxidoreductase|nr:Ldh family oxidoreductase [Verrucomicrobiae bacterium]
MPKFAAKDLEEYAIAVFQAAGSSPHEARIVAQHLIDANLAGHDSHGVLRIPQYLNAVKAGRVNVNARPKIISETASTASVDGQDGFGQVTANECMALGIAKAKAAGISAVTFCNAYHSGRIASYTKLAAAEGFISIVVVNAGGGGQSVAPFGGLGRRLATNPLSIAAPSGNGFPIVLDIATSVAPEGKIRDHFQQRKPVPSGWIIDGKGKPTTNAADFYEASGALLPLGGSAGYKGFGLGFMIDILAGALSGAGCCRLDAPEPQDGLFIIVIDIERFIPLERFASHVEQLVEHVKSSPTAPGFDRVFVPGEVEFEEEKKRRRDGIMVDGRTWDEIKEAAASVDCFHRPLERGAEPEASLQKVV